MHLLYPNFQSLILRKEKADVIKTVIPKWENEILPIHPQNRRSSVKVRGRNSPAWYDWPNGHGRTWIDGCNNPKDFETGAWDLIYVCQGEEIDLDAFEILCARANGRAGNWHSNGRPVGQVIIDANPGRIDNWMEQRIESGKMRKLHFTFEDNPTLFYDGQYTEWGNQVRDELAETLTGHRYTRYFLGQPANAEGAVFDKFDHETMVIDELPTGIETWPVYRAIDFGANHPFVCSWWAKQPGTDLRICIKEYRQSMRVVEDHAAEIIRLSDGLNVQMTWADHDLEDALTLERHGVPTTPAKKSDRLRNIDIVQTLMIKDNIKFYKHALTKVDPRLKENGYPKDLISEIGGWQWKTNATKDEPEKKHDDSIDTMLYVCAGLHMDVPLTVPTGIASIDTSNWSRGRR